MKKLMLLLVAVAAALGLLAGPAGAHDAKQNDAHHKSAAKEGKQAKEATTTTSTTTAAPAAEEPQANGVVTIVHGVPDLSVDIYVDDTLLAAGVAFGDTQTIDQAPGVVHVAVLTAGAAPTDTPVKTFDVEVKSNVNKTVAIYLDADGQARVRYFYDNITQNAAKAQLTVRHLAEGPAVDVYVDGEVAFAGLENGGQEKEFLDAGTYTLKVTAAGDPSTVVVPDTSVTLDANTNTIVSAVGSLTGGTLTTQMQTLAMDCTESCP